METCEPIRLACPKCGSRYRIRSEDVFHLRRTSCGKCREILPMPADHLRPLPVREEQILDWLRSAERDD